MCWALKRADPWLRASPSSIRLVRRDPQGRRVRLGRPASMEKPASKASEGRQESRAPLVQPVRPAPLVHKAFLGLLGLMVKTASKAHLDRRALRVQQEPQVRPAFLGLTAKPAKRRFSSTLALRLALRRKRPAEAAQEPALRLPMLPLYLRWCS